MVSSGIKWLQGALNGIKWNQLASSGIVASGGINWHQVTSGGIRWHCEASSGINQKASKKRDTRFFYVFPIQPKFCPLSITQPVQVNEIDVLD